MSIDQGNIIVPVENIDDVHRQYQSQSKEIIGENHTTAEEINTVRQHRYEEEQRALTQPVAFNPHQVNTWGVYIEVDDVEVTHEQLYKKLRSEFNLYKTKGLRCLLKLLDCVVVWAERSQAYFAAGKDWQQEGNLFQGQLLLETLEDTISEFVSRLGPYQVFQNQEKKKEKLRPQDYPLWKRTPQNGKKVSATNASPKKHADAEHLMESNAAPSPDTCDGRRIPNQRRHRRTMAELTAAKEEPLSY